MEEVVRFEKNIVITGDQSLKKRDFQRDLGHLYFHYLLPSQFQHNNHSLNFEDLTKLPDHFHLMFSGATKQPFRVIPFGTYLNPALL